MDVENIINKSNLFSLFPKEKISSLISNNTITIKNYFENETLFFEGDKCIALGIVIDGMVEIQQNNSYGNSITIAKLTPKNLFGENLIFSQKGIYPMDVVSTKKSTIAYINKKDIINLLMSDELFLSEFLKLLSNKALHLSNKLRQLNMTSLRERIANYILTQSKLQNSSTIKLNCSKQDLANEFGVQRPSLSRELINMKKDGIIDYDRKYIYILNFDKLLL